MQNFVARWAPSVLMMMIIFGFSSIPSKDMPYFSGFDFSIKKFGHALGYALLASTYRHGLLSFSRNQPGEGGEKNATSQSSFSTVFPSNASILAWLMAIFFAATDEFHQSFVPGRNPSLWDIFLFDNGGAILGLWISNLGEKKKKS